MSHRDTLITIGAWFAALGILMQLAATFHHLSQSFADLLGGLCVWVCLMACLMARAVEA